MNTFNIPESLYKKYHGAGFGLAASNNGLLVDIKYFEDIDESLYLESDASPDTEAIQAIIADGRVASTVRYFQSLGDVHVGIFSCYEFVEF